MAADAASLEDDIYECALVPENWPIVLHKLSEIAGARGGCFVAGTPTTLKNWTASSGIAPIMTEVFASGAIQKTNRLGVVLATGSAGFISDDRMFTENLADGDPLYRDHLWPAGLGYATGTAVCMPTGDILIVSLERERAKGPVDEGAIHRLDGLRPHLVRSAYLSARQELLRARDMVALLAQLGLPAAVFSRAAKVLAANELAAGLDHIAWRAGDRIALKDRNADAMLQNALATIDSDVGAPVRSFVVRGAPDDVSMVAHVLPIRGSARDLFVRSVAILMLTPVTMPAGPPVELIQSLFDLTPAEAAVARKIVGGATVDEIASGGGVSTSTVRTHVKGVLAKTGCRRQAEVASLLGNLGRHAPVADVSRS